MQHFLVLSDASEATLRHCVNLHKLYTLYIFLREVHHFVLYVLNGEATLWHKPHKLYSFLTVNHETNKCCLKKQQQPNHAWGSVWLIYDLQCIFGRQQWGQFGVAVFYSRANHIHNVWVRCPGMQHHDKPAHTYMYGLHAGQPAVNWNEVHGSILTFIFDQVLFCQKNKHLLHPQRDWIKYIPLFVLMTMQSFTTSPKSDFLLQEKDKGRSTYSFLGKKCWYTK